MTKANRHATEAPEPRAVESTVATPRRTDDSVTTEPPSRPVNTTVYRKNGDGVPDALGFGLSPQTVEEVASMLGVREPDLRCVFQHSADDLYTPWFARKRGGGRRPIREPARELMKIQSAICDLLSESFIPGPAVCGYARGRGIIHAARPHVGARLLLGFDYDDFFESIRPDNVAGALGRYLPSHTLNAKLALIRLCFFEDRLPQGSPCSGILSNLACIRVDKRLAHLAIEYECEFTRYGDDHFFSTTRPRFPAEIVHLLPSGTCALGTAVTEAIRASDFAVNGRKTRLLGQHQQMRLLGMVVNTRLNLPRTYTNSLGRAIFTIERFGPCVAHQRLRISPKKSIENVVKGRLAHFGHVVGKTDPRYLRFKDRLDRALDSSDAS